MVSLGSAPHICVYGPWRRVEKKTTAVTSFTVDERVCQCGMIERNTESTGAVGSTEKSEIINPHKGSVTVRPAVILKETSNSEMLDLLKKSGYTVEENVIFSPLQCPEGAMLVDVKLWDRQREEFEKTRKHVSLLRKLLGVTASLSLIGAVIDVILLVAR